MARPSSVKAPAERAVLFLDAKIDRLQQKAELRAFIIAPAK
jgi:hypothetical protein